MLLLLCLTQQGRKGTTSHTYLPAEGLLAFNTIGLNSLVRKSTVLVSSVEVINVSHSCGTGDLATGSCFCNCLLGDGEQRAGLTFSR